jgi:hypothetical protein
VGSYAVRCVPVYNYWKSSIFDVLVETCARNTPERIGMQYEHGVQGVASSNLVAPTNLQRSILVTWVTVKSQD